MPKKNRVAIAANAEPVIQTPAAEPTPPLWATYTPEHETTWYSLTQWAPDRTAEQPIEDITREEFIALKRHLCQLRGIPVPESIGEE